MGSVWAVMAGVALVVLLALVLGRWRSLRSGGRRMKKLPAARQEPFMLRSYSPKNVGNDASARPWEATELMNPPLAESLTRQAGVPEGFDVDAFIGASKAHFINLQDAWDRADVPRLRAMMTEDMLTQIQGQLTERERLSGSAGSKTEVVMIEARLLGMEDLGEGHMANVEFSGLMREDGAGPSPFREIWSIARAKTGSSGWLVAGVQALQ